MQGDVEKIVNGVSKVMSKTEDLYLASSDDGGKTWKKLKDKATYWDMIYASSGDTTELFRYYDNDALHIYNRWGIDAKKVGYTKAEDNGNGLINNDGGIKGNVAENEDKNQNSEYISKLAVGIFILKMIQSVKQLKAKMLTLKLQKLFGIHFLRKSQVSSYSRVLFTVLTLK